MPGGIDTAQEIDWTQWMRRRDVARLLDLSEARIDQLISKGAFPSHPSPFGRIYSRSEIEQYKAERDARRQQAPDSPSDEA